METLLVPFCALTILLLTSYSAGSTSCNTAEYIWGKTDSCEGLDDSTPESTEFVNSTTESTRSAHRSFEITEKTASNKGSSHVVQAVPTNTGSPSGLLFPPGIAAFNIQSSYKNYYGISVHCMTKILNSRGSTAELSLVEMTSMSGTVSHYGFHLDEMKRTSFAYFAQRSKIDPERYDFAVWEMELTAKTQPAYMIVTVKRRGVLGFKQKQVQQWVAVPNQGWEYEHQLLVDRLQIMVSKQKFHELRRGEIVSVEIPSMPFEEGGYEYRGLSKQVEHL